MSNRAGLIYIVLSAIFVVVILHTAFVGPSRPAMSEKERQEATALIAKVRADRARECQKNLDMMAPHMPPDMRKYIPEARAKCWED